MTTPTPGGAQTDQTGDPATWRLSGYSVSEFLGRGGFGEVWSGKVKATRRPVALKRLPAGDAAERKAARVEAAVMSALDHPNLIALHELVNLRGYIVMVMDLAARGSLRDLLARRGRLAPGEVVHVLSAVGSAVAYAHNVGVIHSDITPGNILFNSLGIPLLSDLGTARIVGEFPPIAVTAPYVDPVVAAGGAPSKTSDVFMLAATALPALTGQVLWSGSDDEAIQLARTAGDGLLQERLSGIDSAIAGVLQAALSPNPLWRPSASEFVLDLRASCDPIPVEWEAGRVPSDPAAQRSRAAGAHRRLPTASDAPTYRPEAVAPVPVGRRQRVVATLRHRHRELLRATLVAGVLVGAGGWLVQTTMAPDAAQGAATPPQRAAVTSSQPQRAAVTSSQPQRAAVTSPPPQRISAGTTANHLPQPVSAGPDVPDDIPAVLQRLDQAREQAFASNDPSMLSKVYLPGSLLEQDIATMRRLVPDGCGLYGVHTTYTQPRSSATAEGGVSVVVTATLTPSQLRCPGRPPQQVAGHSSVQLRMGLVSDGVRYRLSEQGKA